MASKKTAKSHPPRLAPARFWAVDLHVHTPASADVHADTYGAKKPDEVVKAAVDAGLDAIAITDHNTADWCERVAEAADPSKLLILPGVEISTGQGHLLAIWEVGTKAETIQETLTSAGIKRRDQGKTEAVAKGGIADVARLVVEAGGLAIPAHVERERGLLSIAKVAATLREILLDPCISALEVCDDETVGIVEGKLKGDRRVTYVKGSDTWDEGGDSHALSGIGRRRTWVKASRPDLVGIGHALKDPALRIRLTPPTSPTHHWIRSLRVHGGFLDGEELTFAPDLNCILGGTGTGKSLALELIRFVLDDQTDEDTFKKIREEVDLRLEAALGTDASVEVTLTRGDDDMVIRRTFDVDGSPAPEVLSGHSKAEALRRSVIRAFSQGEVIEYARAPVGRLQLVDGSLDLDEVDTSISALNASLFQNAERLCDLRNDIERAEAEIEGLPGIVERVAELANLFDSDVVKTQGEWAADSNLFDDLELILDEPADVALASSAEFDEDATVESNADLAKRVKAAVAGYVKAIDDANSKVKKARAKAVKELNAITTEWEARLKKFEADLTKELTKVDKEGSGLEALQVRLRDFQKEQRRLEQLKKKVAQSYRPEIQALLKEREELLARLVEARKTRRDLRRERIDELNKKMTNAVRLALDEEVGDDEFGLELERLARGSRLSKKHRDLLTASAGPIKLVRSYLDGSAAGVAKATKVPESRVEAFFENIRDRGFELEFLELQAIDISDGLRVEFLKPESHEYTEIERLSHGQKCTAILVIAMADGAEPLIIDQPEDALHAPWIEKHLVSRLRELRGQRQYLFATRSPGLVVSADAEAIIALGADADRGRVEACGSLERHDLNLKALYHLEGGSDAFVRRTEKLSPSLDLA